MLAKLPSTLVCCFAASATLCAPPGCAARPLRPASNPGTAAPMAVCALLRSRPSAEAIRPITSGVTNCITSETRLMAMELLLSCENCDLEPPSAHGDILFADLAKRGDVAPKGARNATQILLREMRHSQYDT